jgi:hypothetical protein
MHDRLFGLTNNYIHERKMIARAELYKSSKSKAGKGGGGAAAGGEGGRGRGERGARGGGRGAAAGGRGAAAARRPTGGGERTAARQEWQSTGRRRRRGAAGGEPPPRPKTERSRTNGSRRGGRREANGAPKVSKPKERPRGLSKTRKRNRHPLARTRGHRALQQGCWQEEPLYQGAGEARLEPPPGGG